MSERHAFAGLLLYVAAVAGSFLAGLGQAIISAAFGGPFLSPMHTVGVPVCLALAGLTLIVAPFALCWCAWKIARGSK